MRTLFSWGATLALLVALTLVTTRPASGQLSTVASFTYANGANPAGNMVMDSLGNLYGSTQSGGASGGGSVFEIAKGSTTITSLASFGPSNGAFPMGSVVVDSSGNIFGSTEIGGASGNGTIYEVVKGSGTVTTIASFAGGVGGAYPYGGLTLDAAGNLYGTTNSGGTASNGSIFELAKGSTTITTLALFAGGNGGSAPYSGVSIDGSGNIFGTTNYGGTGAKGTVYELAKGASTITTLASFNTTNGATPYGGVIVDSSGNLFGTAANGGASAKGTVYEVASGSNTITTLASFTGGVSGQSPNSSLSVDPFGNLYGTTQLGGTSSKGTLFELAQGSHSIATLASFNGTNGSNILNGVVIDGSGNLFGTANSGGANSYGSVFEFSAPAIVPEPASALLLSLGAFGLAAHVALRRRADRAAASR